MSRDYSIKTYDQLQQLAMAVLSLSNAYEVPEPLSAAVNELVEAIELMNLEGEMVEYYTAIERARKQIEETVDNEK